MSGYLATRGAIYDQAPGGHCPVRGLWPLATTDVGLSWVPIASAAYRSWFGQPPMNPGRAPPVHGPPRSVALRACLRGHVGSGTAPTRPHASLKRDGTLPVRFFVSSVQSSGANRGPVAPSLGCDSGRRSRYAFECWSVSPTGESSSDGAAGSLSLASLEDPPSAPGLPGWSSGAPDSCGSLRSGAVSMIDRLAFRWVDVSVLPAEAGDQVSLAATSERRAAAVRSVSKTCR